MWWNSRRLHLLCLRFISLSYQNSLKKAGILSDVLNDSFDPKVQLSVRFLSSGEEAAFGNTLTPVDAQGQPQVEVLPFPGDKGLPSEVTGKKGFIVMTDPDAPSKDDPKWSEYCHWVASTSLPSAKEGGEVVHNSKDLKDLIAYTKPAPPEGSGKHRYVLVLLQGEGDGSKSLPKSDGGEDRKNWSTGKPRQGLQQWAESNGLKAIGACRANPLRR